VSEFDVDPIQQMHLLVACRAVDVCDRLDEVIRGDGRPLQVIARKSGTVTLIVENPVRLATGWAKTMASSIAAMRLPDETGKRPQRRGRCAGFLPTEKRLSNLSPGVCETCPVPQVRRSVSGTDDGGTVGRSSGSTTAAVPIRSTPTASPPNAVVIPPPAPKGLLSPHDGIRTHLFGTVDQLLGCLLEGTSALHPGR
jgi:hypothetical protein